jgi:hypothetical protein
VSNRAEPWASCPLKQEIRACLWEPFIRELIGGRTLESYLTLYSPSLMDVKYFTDAGLIGFDTQKGMYKGVIGVSYDKQAYAKAIELGIGRPELLLTGDINDILTDVKKPTYKQLLDKSPFEVINLDYEDSIFHGSVTYSVSKHIEALDNLFLIQNKKACPKYCLFFTTRAEQAQLAAKFISELEQIIDQNILLSSGFGQSFNKTYGVNNAVDLLSQNYDDFTTLGLLKLITSILSDLDYEVTKCAATWLNRDGKGGSVRLLHLAFIIEKSKMQNPPPATIVRQYGKRKLGYHARHLLQYLDARATNGLSILKESANIGAMQAKHGDTIKTLLSKTYQLKVPPHSN